MDQQHYEDQKFEKLTFSEGKAEYREFENCTFKFCDFSGSNFSGSRFSDCEFIGCNLSNLVLKNATLQAATFRECKMLGVNFSECDPFLFSVDFEGCMLDYASFMTRKMPKTKFVNCSLKNVVFSNANMEKCVFDRSNLERAIFNQTNLKEADFLTAFNYDIDPELNNIKKARFSSFGLAGLLMKHDLKIS